MPLPPALELLERDLADPAVPLSEHLIELRARLIWMLLFLAAGAAFVFRWSDAFIDWLSRPVGHLIFVAPTEAFYTRLRIAVFGGFALTLPLQLHQVYLFVARALDRRWRATLLALVPASYALFVLGAGLCLYVVVPAAMKFLLSYGSDGLRPMLTLAAYLDFVTGLTLAFGAVFQLPLVLIALGRAGLVDRARLAAARRYVYLLCAAGGALLTPGPDPISQVALALPSIVLFELTLLVMGRLEAAAAARPRRL